MAKDIEQATYVPTKEDAFTLLWLLTMGNMAIGFVFWVWNTVALEFVGLDYASEELEAILWREIGSGFFSFGLLVLVVTLATGAIVSAIDEGMTKTKSRSKA
jgi:phage-related holin